ncbi:Centromere Protein Q [Manis pentadactyla]|nr:Centromere Protein Q [Manis pentadactyla]
MMASAFYFAELGQRKSWNYLQKEEKHNRRTRGKVLFVTIAKSVINEREERKGSRLDDGVGRTIYSQIRGVALPYFAGWQITVSLS